MNTRDDATVPARDALPTAKELLAATGGPGPAAHKPGTGGRGAKGRGKAPARAGKAAESGDADSGADGRIAHAAASLGLAESAEAKALRAAADAEPGVRSRSCLIRPGEDGKTTVTMSIAVTYGMILPQVAERVRARVAKAAPRRLHIRARDLRVDVRIGWIDEPEPGPPGTSPGSAPKT